MKSPDETQSPEAASGPYRRVRSLFVSFVDGLARRPGRAALLLGGTTFVAAVAVGLLTGMPLPAVHDEFSYLLQADTFASGRLTNPTPPMWRHFETFHVIMQPSYASKYPPGQGLVLAVGKLLGHPAVGVWMSAGLMVAAITWMLFEWLPPRWAVLTGLLVALQIGISSYWAQSYWGGAVAATGGALLFGALPRGIRAPSWRAGVLLGLGLVVLALTRPLEGLIVALSAAGLLVHRMIDRNGKARSVTRSVVAPALIVVAAGMIFLGYYNWRVTGSPATFPYAVHENQYAASPTFLWQDLPTTPEHHHAEIERYWRTHGSERLEAYREPSVLIRLSARDVLRNLLFFLGPGVVVLMLLPRALKDRRILFALLVTAGLLLVGLTTTWTYPHYMAPATGLVYASFGACVAAMYRSAETASGGLRRIVLLVAAFGFAAFLRFDPYPSTEAFAQRRVAIRERLEREPGSDLVLVDYGPNHDTHQEWVYNRANLEAAEVVWAREMGADENRELLSRFSERRAWRLEVTTDTIRLTEITAAPRAFLLR